VFKNWKSSHLGFTLAIATVLLTSVYPMLVMILYALKGSQGLTLHNFALAFSEPKNIQALENTLFVALLATFFSLLIGVGMAYLTGRTNLPGRRIIKVLCLLPVFTPPFILAIAWQQLLSPVGYLNQAFQWISHSQSLLLNIYGPTGIILVMTCSSFSMVYLIVEGALNRMDPSLEEAALMCGAPRQRILLDINLPLLLPQILAAGLLVFITEISNFGVPAVLGYQVSYYVLTTRIYQVLHQFYRSDNFSAAASLSILLLVLAVLGLILKDWLQNKGRHEIEPGQDRMAPAWHLGRGRFALAALVMLFLFFLVLLPLAAIGLTSLLRAYGLEPGLANLCLDNYRRLIDLSLVRRAFANSLILALSAATLAVLFGTLHAYLLVRKPGPGTKLLDAAITTPYALPGTVVALAMILAFSRPLPLLGINLYNTLAIILLAYFARYLTFAVRNISAAWQRVHPSLEEAAQASGAGWYRVLAEILLPLLAPGILSAWVLVFTYSVRELTLSILLWSAGNETLAVAIFNLQESGDLTTACALSMVVILFSSSAYLLGHWLQAGKGLFPIRGKLFSQAAPLIEKRG